ncbi:MAG: hypothetical protein IGS23_24580 [Rivularia sp. T60_A2020_040]|nr:hypothetical protein [Rivularia sp. T60_A2020_040]
MNIFHDSAGIGNRIGLKSQAHKLSPLKWTKQFFSPLQRTLAISPEIDFRAGVVDSTE